jgi:hypothetical protein
MSDWHLLLVIIPIVIMAIIALLFVVAIIHDWWALRSFERDMRNLGAERRRKKTFGAGE